MARDCPRCGQYLSGGDLIEGYCWNCKRILSDGEISRGLDPEGHRETEKEDDDD